MYVSPQDELLKRIRRLYHYFKGEQLRVNFAHYISIGSGLFLPKLKKLPTTKLTDFLKSIEAPCVNKFNMLMLVFTLRY